MSLLDFISGKRADPPLDALRAAQTAAGQQVGTLRSEYQARCLAGATGDHSAIAERERAFKALQDAEDNERHLATALIEAAAIAEQRARAADAAETTRRWEDCARHLKARGDAAVSAQVAIEKLGAAWATVVSETIAAQKAAPDGVSFGGGCAFREAELFGALALMLRKVGFSKLPALLTVSPPQPDDIAPFADVIKDGNRHALSQRKDN